MALSPGDKFGPYLLTAPIGRGGMGEVWKARDTRLDRIVAMKFSQEKFSERFEREAKAISSLNHPNICTLYDVGPNYLVMELIEGPTLGERLKEGALPLAEASGIARQIADALDYAHEKGVIHRDLKPAREYRRMTLFWKSITSPLGPPRNYAQLFDVRNLGRLCSWLIGETDLILSRTAKMRAFENIRSGNCRLLCEVSTIGTAEHRYLSEDL